MKFYINYEKIEVLKECPLLYIWLSFVPQRLSRAIFVLLQPGYMLHDRILRPAEVGVTRAVENEADQGSVP